MKALAIVKQQKGARILGTLARWGYKEKNGKLVKYRVRTALRGYQQVEGGSFDGSDLYAPVLRAHAARLLPAIAAAEGRLPSGRQTRVKPVSYTEAWAVTWYTTSLPTGGLRQSPNLRGPLSAASQEHLYIPAGSTQTAHVHLGLGGEGQIPRSEQREVFALHAPRGKGLHSSRPICG